MANKQLNLIYALKDGVIVNVSDVESGLKCGCICPACGEPLVAKKGTKMMHHFAHHTGHNCEYGYESSLHLAAKHILSKAKKFVIPPVYLRFDNSYKKDELICEAKEITIDKVELEKPFDGIIPDIVIYAGNKQLFVEIYVTHKIDDKKLDKLKKADISTIEINLSKKNSTITTEELKGLLLNDSEEKTWKYNSLANKQLKRFYSIADKRKIISRGYALHIDNCPIKSRIYRGKPYANFTDDCLYCKYFISNENDDTILCSGRLRISEIKDFSIPEEKRIKDSNNEIEDLKENAFYAGNCPNCGGRLVERDGQFGHFWGCKNYPHCRFIASRDPKTGKLRMKS